MPDATDQATERIKIQPKTAKLQVLAEHGYPPIRTGFDFVRLQQALFGFLYTLTPDGPAASSLPSTLVDPGTPGRGRDSGEAY